MDPRYDLFELPHNGFPRWISSASDLKDAKQQLEALPDPGADGEYLVRDFYSGSVVAYRAPHLPMGMVVTASKDTHGSRSHASNV